MGHSIDHNPKYYEYGGEEPTQVPFWTFGNAYMTPKWDPTEYDKKTREPTGQMDLYIEGLRMSDV